MSRLYILLLILCLGTSFSYIPVRKFEGSEPQIVKVGSISNVTICQNSAITLTPENYDSEALYEWLDENGNVLAIGKTYTIPSTDTTRVYRLVKYKSDGIENVVNGGFENVRECTKNDDYFYTTEENVGSWWRPKNVTHYWTYDFSSDYSYVHNTSSDALWDEDKFAVGVDPQDYHSHFKSMNAHGGNKMMIVNGNKVISNLANRIWYQKINVEKNTKYAFSFWGSSVTSSNTAELSFYISNTKLTAEQIKQNPNPYRIGNKVKFSSTTGEWNKHFKIWDSKSFSGEKWISVVNSNTEGSGNDFALDDISFTGTHYEIFDIRVEVAPSIFGGSDTEDVSPVCEGEYISLVMNITGSVNKYIWKKGNRLLIGNKNIYKITRPNTGDSGVYTCTAQSVCGEVTKTFNVIVNKNIHTKKIKHKKP